MAHRFDHDAAKEARNLKKHKISFTTAEQVFGDPNQVVVENYWFAEEGEQRYQMIGLTDAGVLLTVVFVFARRKEKRSLESFLQERRQHMKRNSTARKVKITPAVQEAYGKRDKRLDKADADNPVLPPEIWATGVIGKFYRPRKTAVSLRVDNDVLQWLKSKGEGHLTRINEILRQHMLAERK